MTTTIESDRTEKQTPNATRVVIAVFDSAASASSTADHLLELTRTGLLRAAQVAVLERQAHGPFAIDVRHPEHEPVPAVSSAIERAIAGWVRTSAPRRYVTGKGGFRQTGLPVSTANVPGGAVFVEVGLEWVDRVVSACPGCREITSVPLPE